MSLHVPTPIVPARETFDLDDRFEPDELSFHEIETVHDTVEITVDDDRRATEICASAAELGWKETLWTAVFWARQYGVPGIWKEKVTVIAPDRNRRYRLGALYRYAEFPLWERETGYEEHGEVPATAEDVERFAAETATEEHASAHAAEMLNALDSGRGNLGTLADVRPGRAAYTEFEWRLEETTYRDLVQMDPDATNRNARGFVVEDEVWFKEIPPRDHSEWYDDVIRDEYGRELDSTDPNLILYVKVPTPGQFLVPQPVWQRVDSEAVCRLAHFLRAFEVPRHVDVYWRVNDHGSMRNQASAYYELIDR